VKVVKPLKLGVLHRTFESHRKHRFVPTVMLHFSLEHPTVALQDQALWPMVLEELGRELVFDEGMPKARGEFLVAGRAYPRGGEAPVCPVRVRVGSVEKQLAVIGERRWSNGVPTDPKPFRELPIAWSTAFGGPGYEKNPLGKGIGTVRLDGEDVHALPNVEVPGKLVVSPSDRPPPASYRALDPSRPERRARAGTYDSRWLAESFPGLADDVDWGAFNVAPEDQWLADFFTGDEAILLENLHPTLPRIETRLPDLVARAFVTRGDEFREIPLRIDTVHLFPHRLRGVVFFRGVTEVEEDDAADVDVLLAACERRGAPRSIDHYREALARRLDRKRGHIHALREGDLMPPRDPVPPTVEGESLLGVNAEFRTEQHVAQNQRRRAEAELATLRADLERRGLDPAAYLPATVPEPAPQLAEDALADHVEEQLARADEEMKAADAQREAQLRDAREACTTRGVDFDEAVAKQRAEEAGPPKYRAEDEYAKIAAQVELGRNAGIPIPLAERLIGDPDLRRKLAETERLLHDNYRQFSHRFPPAAALDPDASAALRREVEEAVRCGASLAGRDLTGIDLSGLSLIGANLEGAFLEASRLVGCDLSGANLTSAVLVRADLTDAKLVGARLVGANLGDATLVRADLSGGIDLTGVSLGKSRCVGTSFRDARMARNELLDAVLERCDWTGVEATQLNLIGTEERPLDLCGSNFSGCTLEKVNFIHVRLDGADFRGARIVESVFVAVSAEEADFSGADCSNLRMLQSSSLPRARFVGTKLPRANFRGANLAGVDLSDADLTGADLSESCLENARLHRVQAPGAILMKANLRSANLAGANLVEGLLAKSDIEGADFRGANLFRVNFARIKGSSSTRFDDANMKFILFVER